jgi:hypothetical protein
MHVGIDDAGHDEALPGIVFGRDVIARDALDAPVPDVNRRGASSLGRDDTPAADDCQAVSAQNRLRRFIDTRRR